MNAFSDTFGFHALTPPSSLNTNASGPHQSVVGVIGEQRQRVRVEVHDMAAFGLGGGQQRAAGPSNEMVIVSGA
jgi:hypothetical protein